MNGRELDRARVLATKRGLSDRVGFYSADISHTTAHADRVICIGSSHAWHGSARALAALSRHLRPGGRGLYGDGFWVSPPSRQLVEMLGELPASLAELVEQAEGAGLRVLDADTASLREWDEFERGCCRGLEEFARRNPTDPLAAEATTEASTRRTEYRSGYRGVLGFAYLVVGRPSP